MPTTTSKSTSTSSNRTTNPWSADLKDKLAASHSATIYVPLEDGDEQPTGDEIKTLLADGLHVEYDAVRNALAVRKATEDEMAPEPAPVETQQADVSPSTPGASSKVAGVSTSS